MILAYNSKGNSIIRGRTQLYTIRLYLYIEYFSSRTLLLIKNTISLLGTHSSSRELGQVVVFYSTIIEKLIIILFYNIV